MDQEQDFTHAVVVSEDGVHFAARQSGLYRSEDGGDTWQLAYATLELDEPLPTMAVALSPDFVQDGVVFAGVLGGVLLSEDRGHHWKFAQFPEPAPLVTALAVSPDFARDGVILAGTLEDGVFLSHNRGLTWSAWNFGLLDWNVLALLISPDFASDHTVYIGTDTGVCRSTNGGKSWQDLPFPPDAAPVQRLALSSTFSQDKTVIAETESHGEYRSSDGGQTWLQDP